MTFQDINLVESVQKNFTRRVSLIFHLSPASYEERLPMFKLERLELHRLHVDLTNLFKIVLYFTACNIYNVSNFYQALSCIISHNTRSPVLNLFHVVLIRAVLNTFFLTIVSLMFGILCMIIVLILI